MESGLSRGKITAILAPLEEMYIDDGVFLQVKRAMLVHIASKVMLYMRLIIEFF